MPSTHSCADCSESFEAKRKNALYCPPCRLFRDLLFLRDSTQNCWACDAKYSPTKRNMIACADCSKQLHPLKGHCAFCKQDDQHMLQAGLAVCTSCAFDPNKRKELLKSVRHRVITQKEKNGRA